MVMTEKVNKLLTACCEGKGQNDYVFTRDGNPIVEYRKAWERARKAAECPDLLLHDLCRTGMRNMRRLGISEGVAMKVAGRKTASIFRRYDIVDESDLREVARKLDEKQQGQSSHSLAITNPQGGSSEENPKVQVVTAQQKNGRPGGIRTPDPRFRKPLLYPSELQAHRSEFTALLTQPP